MLAVAVQGTVYDFDADVVVQAEFAADPAATAAWVAEFREAARIAVRADELQALGEPGTLEQAGHCDGDEAALDKLTRRVGGYIQADVHAWLAHALAAPPGHHRDLAAREAAADLLTPTVAHAALLTELARLLPGVADHLMFAA
ncbi:hypothetical protein [Streptomyces sp. NPDC088847]|uniref:hypothetical protein n=1 Tax=Streptomyces sp. NPDC088847 TaxID=3365909 RepID=UPI0037F2346D